MTSNGVLRPAEARQACLDLGIDFGGQRLRSALDVHELMRDWVIAEAAGFLLVDGTRARGVDLEDAGSPEGILDAWVAAAASQLDLADDEPCLACLVALHELHIAPEPIALDQLMNAVAAKVELTEPGGLRGAPCPGCGEIHWDDADGDADLADHVTVTIVEMLAFSAAEFAEEKLRLTPLGGFLTGQLFQGLVIPPDAEVSAVVSVFGATAAEIGQVLVLPWLGARSPSAAAKELLAFAESATGLPRVSALAIVSALGIESADAWREWADRPGFGAYARLWLFEHDEPVAEDPADEGWMAADGLNSMLESLADLPPEVLYETVFDQIGGEMAEAAKLVLGSGHPKADNVAAWLTDHQQPEPDPVTWS